MTAVTSDHNTLLLCRIHTRSTPSFTCQRLLDPDSAHWRFERDPVTPPVETAAAFCGVVDDGAQRPFLSTPYNSYLASERQHAVRWTTRCQVAVLRACRSTLHRCSVLGCRRCPKRCVPISRRAPNGTKTMITDTMMATEVPWRTAMAACAIRNGDA